LTPRPLDPSLSLSLSLVELPSATNYWKIDVPGEWAPSATIVLYTYTALSLPLSALVHLHHQDSRKSRRRN
jgi:hypothetical protein